MPALTRPGVVRAGGISRFPAAILAGVLMIAAALFPSRPAAADAPWLNVSEDGFASFNVPASYVRQQAGEVSQVVIEGNFGPSFAWAEYGLTLRGDVWTGVLGPLPPGLYHYQITADDTKSFKDPTNDTRVASKPLWSAFLVRGEESRLLEDAPEGQRGKVETLTYRTGKKERSVLVWTPPGHSANGPGPKALPVLYLRTGADGSASDWVDLARAPQILDNLTARKAIEPMVVVFDGGDGPDDRKAFDDLRKAVADRYRVHRDHKHQAIAGTAEGGTWAVRTALSRPATVGYAGSFSGLATEAGGKPDGKAVNHTLELLRLYTGNVIDPAYNATVRLTKALDRAGIRYQFDGVNPDAAGNWHAWRENLIDFLPRLFRKGADPGPTPGHGKLKGEFHPPAPGTTPTPFVSEDGFVTFETTTEFTDARHVTVWGNWAPNGSWLRMPMVRAGDRWRVTVGPLEPWFYYYQFFVDLKQVKDTSNPTKVTSEPTWSHFLVEGERARLVTDVPEGKGGKVEELTYRSNVVNEERTALVWTPPGYDPKRAEPYPVLYLQHGGGQSYTDWVEMGRAKQILDNLSLDGKLVPMVVVMGNGNVPDFTRELLENIVPAAREHYNISDDPARQALAGLSMGGAQTLDVLKSRPGTFGYIGVFSAWFGPTDGVDVDAINNGTKLLRLYVGDQTDFVYPIFMESLAALDELGIRYEFDGPTPGPHGWDVWQRNLIDFAPRLFRS
jgi:enterochelin esterase-like enzyme|nr:MAG: esterase [Actinomycetota bacterium]